jgi:hypothetical protein
VSPIISARASPRPASRATIPREPQGDPVEQIPEGYTISESVNGIVSLVKARPAQILPEEVAAVESAVRWHPKSRNYRVGVRQNRIEVYERVGPDVNDLLPIVQQLGGMRPGLVDQWSFRNNRLLEPVDVTVANLVAALGRYQGRQDLYQHQVPQVLETLRRTAIVESTEASNRIEGIVVKPHRLKARTAQATPQTRSESEIAGYRNVLARIHTGQLGLPITLDVIRAIHADMYAYLPSEGGQWKQPDLLASVQLECVGLCLSRV